MKKRSKNHRFVAPIIVAAVLAVLVAGTAAAGIYVSGLTTVYPNVSVDGVLLAGKTAEEAQKALTDAGYEQKAANVSATVDFPDGESLTVTGLQSGVARSASDAVQAAVTYGRDGSFLSKEFNYFKCLLTKHDIGGSDMAAINEQSVKKTIGERVDAFNAKIMKDACKVTDTSIVITKGNISSQASTDDVYAQVTSALKQSIEKNAPVTVSYSVGKKGGSSIDLKSIYDSIHVVPVSAVYDASSKKVSQSVTGVGFDVDAAQKLLDDAQTGATVTIPLVVQQPDVTTDQLNAKLFGNILSQKTTSVGGTSNRVNNVRLATKSVNGTILNPGETFSYNNTLGERTAAKGYREAGAYVGNQVVQELGGGICQLSSTLYYDVLYANLQVVERTNHMFIVTYLPLGIDATVDWGTVDFKFKNNTANPIKIEAVLNGSNLTVTLYGTKPDTNHVQVSSVVVSKTNPQTVQQEDAGVAAGKTVVKQSGEPGYVVDTYKLIYDQNNNLVSKTFIARNKYSPENRIVLVPVGTLPSASPSPSETPAQTETAAASASPAAESSVQG